MADAAYSRRDVVGGAVATTITAGINSSDTAITLTLATGWPSGTNGEFGVLIDEGEATEEKVLIDTRSGTGLTVTASGRGVDGTTAAAHTAGATIRPCILARDIDEANKAVAEYLAKATTAGMLPWVSAAQVVTMLAIGTAGQVVISSGSAPTWQSLSGDVTVNSSGVTAIGASKVTNAMMADNAVDSAEIVAGAVDTAHLGDLQVTTGKIADLGVTAGKIGANAVTVTKINDGAVQLGKLGNDSVPAAALLEAARPRWVVGPFNTIQLTGTGTDSSDYGGSSTTHMEAVAFEGGSIVGVSVFLTSPRTGGTLDAEVFLDGVATGLKVTIDGSNTTHHYAVQAAGTDTFVAGQTITVKFTGAAFTTTAGVAFTEAAASVLCQVT